MAVVLDWRRPNEKGFAPFPPNLFAPVASATAGPLEKVGGATRAYTPDFSITPEAEAFVPPESFIPRYSFEAQLPENLTNPVESLTIYTRLFNELGLTGIVCTVIAIAMLPLMKKLSASHADTAAAGAPLPAVRSEEFNLTP